METCSIAFVSRRAGNLKEKARELKLKTEGKIARNRKNNFGAQICQCQRTNSGGQTATFSSPFRRFFIYIYTPSALFRSSLVISPYSSYFMQNIHPPGAENTSRRNFKRCQFYDYTPFYSDSPLYSAHRNAITEQINLHRR